MHQHSNGTNARLEITMGLGFILGVLAGFIAAKLYDIAYDWYTWHTYKDNIDWDTDGE